MKLHRSATSNTGYRGVTRLPSEINGGGRRLKIFRMKHGSRGRTAQFYTSLEAAIAYAQAAGEVPKPGGRPRDPMGEKTSALSAYCHWDSAAGVWRDGQGHEQSAAATGIAAVRRAAYLRTRRGGVLVRRGQPQRMLGTSRLGLATLSVLPAGSEAARLGVATAEQLVSLGGTTSAEPALVLLGLGVMTIALAAVVLRTSAASVTSDAGVADEEMEPAAMGAAAAQRCEPGGALRARQGGSPPRTHKRGRQGGSARAEPLSPQVMALARLLMSVVWLWLLPCVDAVGSVRGGSSTEMWGVRASVEQLTAAVGLGAVLAALAAAHGREKLIEALDSAAADGKDGEWGLPPGLAAKAAVAEPGGGHQTSGVAVGGSGERTPRTEARGRARMASSREAHRESTPTAAQSSTRDVLASRAEARQRQTPRSRAWAEARAAEAAAGAVLGAVPRSTWYVLAFRQKLVSLAHAARERCQRREDVLMRCTLLLHPSCKAFCEKLRAMAAARARVLKLLQREPRAVLRDVVYDAATGEFSFRDVHGHVCSEHPVGAADGEALAFARDGSMVEPLAPPPTSSVVLCPEASGGWCYYDTTTGTTAWFPPEGSVALTTRVVPTAAMPSAQPPRLPPSVGLGALRDTEWLLIRSDADSALYLMHKGTAAVRAAPWASFLTPSGEVYFANLVTRETRWLPPHRWMEGWLHRAEFGEGTPVSSASCIDGCIYPTVWGRRFTERDLLPQAMARRLVEGGAPYMLDPDAGVPTYPPDDHDTSLTYPLAGYARRAAGFTWTERGGGADLAETIVECPGARYSREEVLRGRWMPFHAHWVPLGEAVAIDAVPPRAGYLEPGRLENDGASVATRC